MSTLDKSCRIIALFNQAGGVAKTTLTMNLGYHLAQRGQRVLLIDMDPQGSLSIFMGSIPEELPATLYEAVVDEKPLYIVENFQGMDLAPTNQDLRIAEMQLVSAELRDFRLKNAIEPIKEEYDFILIDCPPSLGILSYISLVAATHILVPVQTQFKAFEGTNLLLETYAQVRTRVNRQLKLAGFVPTIYAAQNSQDVRALAAINEQLSPEGKVFPPIPRATAFADASENRVPLAVYNSKHPAVAVLDSIAQSLEEEIE